jgi:hypothetical protein
VGIHRCKINLDSGLFRVVQYPSSIQTRGREKTGMTVLGVVYNEKRSALMQAFFTLPSFSSYVVFTFAAPTSSLIPLHEGPKKRLRGYP